MAFPTGRGPGANEAQLRLLVEQVPAAIAMLDRDMHYLAASRRYLSELGVDDIVGRSHYEVFPEIPERWKQVHRRCLAGAAEHCEEDSFVRADGRVQWIRWAIQPWHTDSGEIGGLLAFGEDITERKRIEDTARVSKAHLAAELDAMTRLHRLALLVESGGDLDSLLGDVVDDAIAITGADFGNIQLVDPVSSALHMVAQRGFPQWWVDFWNNVPGGEGSCGASLQRGERVIVEDIERSPIFAGTSYMGIQLKAGIRAVQSTPLVSRSGKIIGMFSTHYKTPRRPDEHALRLLDLLARQAADSIEHAQQSAALRKNEDQLRALNAQLEQRVKERTRELRALQGEVLSIAMLEQRRIGQELHDGTQQELTGLGLLAQSLSEKLSQQGARGDAELAARVAAGIAQANMHVRHLAHGLIPVPIDADSLPAALAGLADSTQRLYGLSCHSECLAPVKVSDADAATHLFRIAQEAVANTVKHAKAGTITIRLGYVNGGLTLEIADDGIGSDPLKRPVEGVGLRLMEHRCNLVGGRFRMTPRAGGGTVVTCTVPSAAS